MTTTPECPICGGPAELVRERVEIAIGKRRVTVAVERIRCSECDEAFYLPEQMDAALAAASAELRKRKNLLQGDEIRAIRQRLRLSQRQFEQLLGLGEKTVVRWERGIVFQNRATDLLIRLIGELPQTVSLLSEWNGIALPPGDLPRAASASSRGGSTVGGSVLTTMAGRRGTLSADEPRVFAIESKMKDALMTKLPVRGATETALPIDTSTILKAFK